MTLNTFLKKILFHNKFKFIGVMFMFIVSVILFFSFDSEANEMKRLENVVTNVYKQQNARIDIVNPQSGVQSDLIKQVMQKNQTAKFPQLKVKIVNNFANVNQLQTRIVNKYGKYLDFEVLKTKEINGPKKAPSFSGNMSRIKKAVNLIKPTKNISKYYIQKGKNDLTGNNIIIDKFLSVKQKLNIGDYYKIGNKNYKISGIFGLPQQIISQSFNIDGSVILSDINYNKISGEEKISLLTLNKLKKDNNYYNKIYDQLLNDKAFVTTLKIPQISKDLFSDVFNIQNKLNSIKYKEQEFKMVQGVAERENDAEANLIHIQPDIHLLIAKTIAIVFSTILAILMTVIISKIINNYAVEIGVLKSFGYQKGEILSRFTLIPVFISIIAISIGFIIGRFILSVKLLELLTKEFSLPLSTSPQINIATILYGMVFPFIVIMLSVIYNANKLINRPSVLLLRDISNNNKVTLSKFLNKFSKKWRMKRLVRLRLLTNSMSKTIAVFIGITFSSMLVFFAIFFASSINHSTNALFDTLHVTNIKFDATKFVKDNNKYKSSGLVNALKITEIIHQDKNVKKSNKVISNSRPKIELLMAYKPNNTEFKFNQEQSKELENGIYLSSSYKNDYNLKIGDKLKVALTSESFSDKTKNKRYVLNVKGFYESVAPIFSFTTYNYASKLFNQNNKVNATFSSSGQVLDQFKTNGSVNWLKLNEFKDQISKMLIVLWYIVLIFGAVAFLILLPIILILSSIIIDDNRKNMGILKALGYTNNELGSMMINIYNPIVFLGIICGMMLGYVLTLNLFGLFASLGMSLNLYYNVITLVAGALIIFVVYIVNIKIASRNIKKVIPIKELSSFT